MTPLISIVINCYRAQAAVAEQILNWHQFSPAMLEQVEFVIVDDGSDPALQIDRAALPANARLVMARIEQDIAWNMPGARNLGALLARGRFLLFHDVDHFLPAASLKTLLALSHSLREDAAYRFSRMEGKELINPPVNCFLCSRDSFWRVGGYDEDFAGHYGYEDGYFHTSWRSFIGPTVLMNDVFLEVRPRFATTGLSRDTSHNAELFKQKVAEGPVRARSRLRFPWALVPA